MPKENKAGMPYRLDLFIAVISLLFPWGWSVSGFPPSIELACICWAVTLACSLHYFWAWSKNKWRKTERWLVMIIVPVLVLTFSWRPVKNQYHIQHSPSALAPTDPKVLAAVNGVGSNFNALTSLLATNQFDTRLPILASSQKDLFIGGMHFKNNMNLSVSKRWI